MRAFPVVLPSGQSGPTLPDGSASWEAVDAVRAAVGPGYPGPTQHAVSERRAGTSPQGSSRRTAPHTVQSSCSDRRSRVRTSALRSFSAVSSGSGAACAFSSGVVSALASRASSVIS